MFSILQIHSLNS